MFYLIFPHKPSSYWVPPLKAPSHRGKGSTKETRPCGGPEPKPCIYSHLGPALRTKHVLWYNWLQMYTYIIYIILLIYIYILYHIYIIFIYDTYFLDHSLLKLVCFIEFLSSKNGTTSRFCWRKPAHEKIPSTYMET